MKNILIVLPDIFAIRNFLEAPFTKMNFKENDVRVVFVLSNPKKYRNKITGNNSIVLENIKYPRRKKGFKKYLDKLFLRINKFLNAALEYRFNKLNKLRHQIIKEQMHKKYILDKRHDSFNFLIKYPFPKSRMLYKLFYSIYNSNLFIENRTKDIINKYLPRLIIVANCQKAEVRSYTIEAERRNVKCFGFINSWDHLTTDGPVLKNIDEFISWNQRMEYELKNIQRTNKSVHNIGPIQMDSSFIKGNILNKNSLYNKISIEKNKKIIVFGVYNKRLGSHEPSITNYIVENILDKYNIHLIIRGHPKDATFYERYERFINHQNVTLCKAGEYINGKMRKKINDQILLNSVLKHASLVICGPTTLTLDALRFNKPIINIEFDGDLKLPPENSIRKRYKWEHYSPLLKYNAIYFVKNYQELEKAIKKSLEKPRELDEGRKLLRQMYLEPLDGQASNRLFNLIINLL